MASADSRSTVDSGIAKLTQTSSKDSVLALPAMEADTSARSLHGAAGAAAPSRRSEVPLPDAKSGFTARIKRPGFLGKSDASFLTANNSTAALFATPPSSQPILQWSHPHSGPGPGPGPGALAYVSGNSSNGGISLGSPPPQPAAEPNLVMNRSSALLGAKHGSIESLQSVTAPDTDATSIYSFSKRPTVGDGISRFFRKTMALSRNHTEWHASHAHAHASQGLGGHGHSVSQAHLPTGTALLQSGDDPSPVTSARNSMLYSRQPVSAPEGSLSITTQADLPAAGNAPLTGAPPPSAASTAGSTFSERAAFRTSPSRQLPNGMRRQFSNGNMPLPPPSATSSAASKWRGTMSKAISQAFRSDIPMDPMALERSCADMSMVLALPGEYDTIDESVSFSTLPGGGSVYRQMMQFNVIWGTRALVIRLPADVVVSAAIRTVMTDFVNTYGDEVAEAERVLAEAHVAQHTLFRNIGTSSVVYYVPIAPSAVLAQCEICQGDTLHLINLEDVATLSIVVLPSMERMAIEYAYDTLVSEVTAALEQRSAPPSVTYALYHSKLSHWLVPDRSLMAYRFAPDTVLEWRPKSPEILIRVELEEQQQKIAFKVLSSQTVADLLELVLFQMGNRSLKPQVSNGVYGLWSSRHGRWMTNSAVLAEVPDLHNDTLVYRVHWQSIQVKWFYGNDDPLTVLADQGMTVAGLRHLCCQLRHTAWHASYNLYTRWLAPLDPDQSIWTLASDIGGTDNFWFRDTPQPLTITCSDNSHAQTVPWSYGIPLRLTLPFICRRLGVPAHMYDTLWLVQNCGTAAEKPAASAAAPAAPVAAALELATAETASGNGTPVGTSHRLLDLDASLTEQHVAPGATVMLRLKRLLTEPPSPDDLWAELRSGQTLDPTPWEQTHKPASGSSLNRLIERLTDEISEGSSLYLDFVKNFLLTYSSFSDANTIMSKLMDRYNVPNLPEASVAQNELSRKTIQLRVCNVLLQWVKRFRTDFIDETRGPRLQEQLLAFAENVVVYDHPAMTKQLRRATIKMRDDMVLRPGAILNRLRGPGQAVLTNVSLFQRAPEEIAQQMTLIEQQLFAAITPNELLCQSWAQRDAATRAPNITQLTSHFNALALWTVKSVVEPATVKQRAKRLSFLVDVAEQLREMGNYSTLMAIIAGLNKASVLRLKLTLKECGPKCLRKMSELETLMSADGAYRNYRTVVKSSILPCIPYIGVVLLDLTFMEDGNQDRIGDHINFVKRQMIAEVIRDLELKQTTAYPFKWNDEVARSFVLLPRASVEYESQLWAESKRKESSQPAQ